MPRADPTLDPTHADAWRLKLLEQERASTAADLEGARGDRGREAFLLGRLGGLDFALALLRPAQGAPLGPKAEGVRP